MPSNLNEWMFWIFSTIIVGLIIGIGVNLITPKVKGTGESWLQYRRLNKQVYKNSLSQWSLDLDKGGSSVYLYFSNRVLTYATMLAVGFLFLITQTAILSFLNFSNPAKLILTNETFQALVSASLISNVVYCFFFVVLLMQTIQQVTDLTVVHYNRKAAEREEDENHQEGMLDTGQSQSHIQ